MSEPHEICLDHILPQNKNQNNIELCMMKIKQLI